ncbi:hypothetical protein QQP08_020775 [Theobroma cacao]|nr:hypothetical protein QQP08_020775 [Theobroma cacao]
MGLDIGPPSSLIENVKEIPQTFGDRESHLPLSSSITIDKDPQVELRRNKLVPSSIPSSQCSLLNSLTFAALSSFIHCSG